MDERDERGQRGQRAASAPASKKRVGAMIALWTVVMGGVSFAAGCYGKTCDGDIQVWGRDPNQGRLIDVDTWETGPIDGAWLPFPHQRLYILDLHDLGDRVPTVVIPYVSAQADPLKEGGNFTIAAGNLTEISAPAKGQVFVKNDTCADYWVRVVVETAPRPPTPPPSASAADAGGDAEAGP